MDDGFPRSFKMAGLKPNYTPEEFDDVMSKPRDPAIQRQAAADWLEEQEKGDNEPNHKHDLSYLKNDSVVPTSSHLAQLKKLREHLDAIDFTTMEMTAAYKKIFSEGISNPNVINISNLPQQEQNTAYGLAFKKVEQMNQHYKKNKMGGKRTRRRRKTKRSGGKKRKSRAKRRRTRR